MRFFLEQEKHFAAADLVSLAGNEKKPRVMKMTENC